MAQSGGGFTTAALFSRPLGASQPAKAVSLASKGVKVSRMHAMGVKGVMVACKGAKRVEKATWTLPLLLKAMAFSSRLGSRPIRARSFNRAPTALVQIPRLLLIPENETGYCLF